MVVEVDSCGLVSVVVGGGVLLVLGCLGVGSGSSSIIDIASEGIRRGGRSQTVGCFPGEGQFVMLQGVGSGF